MNLKNKLINSWNTIKAVLTETFVITSQDKLYKQALYVNRKNHPYFNVFLMQYNCICFSAVILSILNLFHLLMSGSIIGSLMTLLLVWVIYVARIKGLASLSKFFNETLENFNTHKSED